MRNDHIIILKKIPVDPKHVEALRLRKEREISSQSLPPLHDDAPQSSQGLYRFFSFLLFCAFLVNPIGVAYAEEVTPLPDLATQADSGDTKSESMPEPGVTVVTPPEDGEAAPSESSETDGSGSLGSSEGATTEEPSIQAEGGEDELLSTGTTSATGTVETFPSDDMGTSSATSTDDGGISLGAGESEISTGSTTDDRATTTEDVASSTEQEVDMSDEEISSSLDREQTPEERAAERMAAEAAMREQIKKEVEAEMRSRCVSYGDEGYYCVDETSSDRITSTRPIERVISDRGSGGDKEIVIVRTLPEGESRIPVTENEVDDEFPNADGEMKMIVWQTLMNGRWQIAYREQGGVIEYLTANKDGNGHPSTDGRRIVWQGWSQDNWDIFLAEPGDNALSFSTTSDGVLEGIHPGWKVTRLSDGATHDMFPKVAGNFVTWQEHHENGWVIVVYDLSTGRSRIVEGESGGTGEAPTVALIYRERTKEGRVFIRARDLATGDHIPLRDDEIPEPAKLPIPEQSGALPLQNGTSSLTSIRIEGDGDGTTAEI